MKVTTQTMIKNYGILSRLYDKKFAREETRKRIPTNRKQPRKYTILVGWSVPIDLDLNINSFSEAKRMSEELKRDHPNNMFLAMWKDKAEKNYDKALDINWNLDNIHVIGIEGLGGELTQRKRGGWVA